MAPTYDKHTHDILELLEKYPEKSPLRQVCGDILGVESIEYGDEEDMINNYLYATNSLDKKRAMVCADGKCDTEKDLIERFERAFSPIELVKCVDYYDYNMRHGNDNLKLSTEPPPAISETNTDFYDVVPYTTTPNAVNQKQYLMLEDVRNVRYIDFVNVLIQSNSTADNKKSQTLRNEEFNNELVNLLLSHYDGLFKRDYVIRIRSCNYNSRVGVALYILGYHGFPMMSHSSLLAKFLIKYNDNLPIDFGTFFLGEQESPIDFLKHFARIDFRLSRVMSIQPQKNRIVFDFIQTRAGGRENEKLDKVMVVYRSSDNLYSIHFPETGQIINSINRFTDTIDHELFFTVFVKKTID